MSDVSTVWSASQLRGDWVQAGSDLQYGDELTTALLISLFTDRVANADDTIPDGTTDPRGWWADDAKYPIGSRLWLLGREKQIDSVAQRAKDYCKEALQWMLDDGIVARFDIDASWVRASLLGIQISAYRQDGTRVALNFGLAWGLSQAEVALIQKDLPRIGIDFILGESVVY